MPLFDRLFYLRLQLCFGHTRHRSLRIAIHNGKEIGKLDHIALFIPQIRLPRLPHFPLGRRARDAESLIVLLAQAACSACRLTGK